MTQLEQLGADTSPAATACRDRIRDQFTTRYDQHTTARAELDARTAAVPPPKTPASSTNSPTPPNYSPTYPPNCAPAAAPPDARFIQDCRSAAHDHENNSLYTL
jgi:hypothetical protein